MCDCDAPKCACCDNCWDHIEEPTPVAEVADFELGTACDLDDTECESCQ